MIEEAIQVLNEALALDPDAVNAIMLRRVPCNEKISDHPTIQVGNGDMSALGLINGLFGINKNGYGFITANVDEITGRIESFNKTKE